MSSPLTITNHLPQAAQIISTSLAALIGLSGLRTLLPNGTRPFLAHFGLPTDDATCRDPLIQALATLCGARNVMFGGAVLALQSRGMVQAVGMVFLAGLVVPGADAWVAWRCGGGMGSHVWGGVVSGVVGGYLVWIG